MMCGHQPCEPITDACTWSEAFKKKCLDQYMFAKRLFDTSIINRNLAIEQFRQYERSHSEKEIAALKQALEKLQKFAHDKGRTR